MKFEDFKGNEKDLEGKFVLWHHGQSYSPKLNRAIKHIVKVTKTGFRIRNVSSLFSFNGEQKGLTGKFDRAIISYCELITDDEAKALWNEWKERREVFALREKMIELVKVADKDKLLRVYEILMSIDKTYEN